MSGKITGRLRGIKPKEVARRSAKGFVKFILKVVQVAVMAVVILGVTQLTLTLSPSILDGITATILPLVGAEAYGTLDLLMYVGVPYVFVMALILFLECKAYIKVWRFLRTYVDKTYDHIAKDD